MKVKFVCHTNGKGLWSAEARAVKIVRIDVGGEVRAYFDDSWDVEDHGLIYTDPLWIKEFRQQLVRLGCSRAGANDVDYSEQGMQGEDYVSMDAGEKFLNCLKFG